MTIHPDSDLQGHMVRAALTQERWQVPADPDVLGRVFEEVGTRRRRRRAGVAAGLTFGAMTLAVAAPYALTRFPRDATPVVAVQKAAEPNGEISALNTGEALPNEVLKSLEHVPFPGPFTGALVATTSAGDRVYLAKTGNAGMCIVVVSAVSVEDRSVTCSEQSAVLTSGVYLAKVEPGRVQGVIVVPDGYTNVTSGGRSTKVSNNVAVIEAARIDTVTMTGPGFRDVTVNIGVAAWPEQAPSSAADPAGAASASSSASAPAFPTRPSQPPVLPGGDGVTRLGTPTLTDGAGTQTVQLGPPPTGATHIDTEFSCLTEGTFKFADGSSMSCGARDIYVEGQPAMTFHKYRLAPGQDTITIAADEGARWRLLAAYARVEKLPWGVNARGETYGVQNDDGTPTLVGAIATNRRSGYVYAHMLEPTRRPTSPAEAATMVPEARAPIPVYESAGRTAIGDFAFSK